MAKAQAQDGAAAVRIRVSGRVQGVFFRQTTQARARELGVMGWVRNEDDGSVLIHAEGPRAAIEALGEFVQVGPPKARVEAAEVSPAKVEGHEQFAIRGVSAGEFVVLEWPEAGADGESKYELRLEVAGGVRAWKVPKPPSMDPSVKRLAIAIESDGASAGGTGSAETGAARPGEAGALADIAGSEVSGGGAIVWDRGPYEQGGRVPWPEAIERGHAVFVLHGERLRGGFALQRTGPEGARWLLIKRRDPQAHPTNPSF